MPLPSPPLATQTSGNNHTIKRKSISAIERMELIPSTGSPQLMTTVGTRTLVAK